MNKIIEVKNLSHAFREKVSTEALKDVSFEIKKGEFFTILGPSGCGKSTLLRILAGTIAPTKGKIFFGEGKMAKAMIFQSFALFPWLNVYQNVGFGLVMKNILPSTRQTLIREHIKEIGLSGFEKNYPKDLSGGMKQRVGIARALAVSPQILLMDEPTSALDAFTAQKLREEILEFWLKDKMTVVMVTHSVEEAIQMSDRVLVMTPRPGRVEEILEIGLSRPRDRRTKEFFALEDKISGLVKI